MAGNPIKVELPGDRLYADDCYITTFTLGDAETLSIIQKTADTKQLYELINKRINLSVNDLTLQDLWFILHWQRINSYPKYPLNLPWECPHCTHNNSHELSGSSLVIEDLNPKYEHGLTVDLPSAGKLKLRLPLVGDENTARNFLKELRYSKPDPQFMKEILVACMLEPNGGTIQERLRVVQELTADDGFVIKGFEQYFEYGVQNYAKFTCEACGEVSKVKFRFDLTTFFPRISHSDDIRSRILFSEAFESANRDSEQHGSGESDLHQGATCEEPERAQAEERPSESEAESQVKNFDDINSDR